MGSGISVFLLTYFGYACVHACRKSFSNAKAVLNISSSESGVIDSVFMLGYSIALLGGGLLGDRYNARKVLGFGLIGTSLTQAVIGFYLRGSPIQLPILLLLFLVSACMQSLCWPSGVKLLGQWFKGKGKVFGIWSTNASLGNIIGGLLAVWALSCKGSEMTSVEGVFVYPALLTGVLGILVFTLLPDFKFPGPNSQPLVSAADQLLAVENGGIAEQRTVPSFRACLNLPGILDFSVSYASLKGAGYAIFFWLPLFLVKARGYSVESASSAAVVFDAGQVVGGPLIGLLADSWGKKGRPIAACGLFSLLAVLPLIFVGLGKFEIFAIFVAGIGIGGSVGLLGSAVCASLAPESAGTVVGIVDGFGSLGASATQLLIPIVAEKSWDAVFPMLAVMSAVSAFCLIREAKRESMKN